MASSAIHNPDGTCNAHYNLPSIEINKAPEVADSIDYQDEYEKSNAALHLAWSARMAEGNYKNPSFYKNVSCLLVSWDKDCDDLDTEEEVAALANVFKSTFHFKVKRRQLTNDPDHLPHLQVLKYITEFLWDEDDAHSLLLFYYAGHGAPKQLRDGSNSLALTGKCPYYNYAGKNNNEVLWGYLEDSFQQTKADVLEIFDCCYAGDIGRTRQTWQTWGTRSFEFLGACSSGNTTLCPGKGSFTTALIWALKALVKDQIRFTLSELSCKIRDAPYFPRDQVPVQFDRGVHTLEQIIVAPLPETGNDESESIDESVPQGLLHLNFFFEKPPSKSTIDSFAQGMNRLVYEQGLPINRIVWGGLISWGGVQPSQAGQETMMKAVKMMKDAYRRRLSRKIGDRTIQLPESASSPGISEQSKANTPCPHDLNVLGKGVILIISSCFLLVLLAGSHRIVYCA